eukprot:CAMPEP_0171173676 /NCGR_PEP_ID=MMETSP0790-20130122/10343_1 /TAXON_ID=2925 /ORGANISM="Alexandrium catenella, Strain OF101" /LENGTH=361 /DNA_ID=CAMNT_0011638543 /DNA_START=171 /DNA_END=1255 /DNA_ORIENTATION=-
MPIECSQYLSGVGQAHVDDQSPSSLHSGGRLTKVDAEAVLVVVAVLASVDPAVRPAIVAAAVHHGALPPAIESAAVCIGVLAKAVNQIITPLSDILGAIWPSVDAKAVLLAEDKLPHKLRAIQASLDAVSALEVVVEVADVGGSAFGLVCAKSACHALSPLAHVDIAVGMGESALAVRGVPAPFTDVVGSVGPGLLSKAVSFAIEPLPIVNSTRLEGVQPPDSCSLAKLQGSQLFELDAVAAEVDSHMGAVAEPLPASLVSPLSALRGEWPLAELPPELPAMPLPVAPSGWDVAWASHLFAFQGAPVLTCYRPPGDSADSSAPPSNPADGRRCGRSRTTAHGTRKHPSPDRLPMGVLSKSS